MRVPSGWAGGSDRGHDRRCRDGAGVGLAIVDSIVRAHDGTLTLSPRPDGGLRTTVELPTTARSR
ncbi:ATP-binding protein [Pedococcus sp. P5_B7]